MRWPSRPWREPAAIGGNLKHACRAEAPRLRSNRPIRHERFPPLEKRPRPEAEWQAAGANALLLQERYVEAAAMERAARISDKPDHWHRASQLWLHAENAPPLHQQLAARPDPEDACWRL